MEYSQNPPLLVAGRGKATDFIKAHNNKPNV